ncbi:MAG: SDR family NAD(P)-dependent oxidoreductase [Fidelibacterota bacterium]
MKVFITGASSGIGEHLAYVYARRGARLGLAARRKDLLRNVAKTCIELGATVEAYPLDVRDTDACKETVAAFLQKIGGIDIVIANAGVGGPDHLSSGDATAINGMLTTNILGVTNIVIPFIPTMKAQGAGKIVIVSSVAGYRGLAGRGGYSGSKAAVRIMADSWRHSLSRYGLQVSTICPGFIKTPMVEKNRFPMPFLMETSTAAEKIAGAIHKGKKTYIVPWQWRIIVPILRSLPDSLIHLITFSHRQNE